MILPRPLNPPYRTPARSTSASPPPLDLEASPKRKRGTEATSSTTSTEPDSLKTHELIMAETGSNSPRSKVAEKFKSLDLHHHHHHHHSSNLQQHFMQHHPLTPDHSPRKRLKTKEVIMINADENDHTTSTSKPEIPETPSDLQPYKPQPSPQKRPISPTNHLTLLRSKDAASSPSHSQPLPTSSSSSSSTSAPFRPYSPRPHPSTNPLLPPRSSEEISESLTWHPHEITGATVDPLCADDDGEGINGVGFRPSAQQAAVRREKRLRQVSEWKAREAREARGRRAVERRKRGGGDDGEGEGEAVSGGSAGGSGRTWSGRVVRFEGVNGS